MSLLKSSYKWHRLLAWCAGIMLLLWACSGILHPVLSWMGPRAAAFKPPVTQFSFEELKLFNKLPLDDYFIDSARLGRTHDVLWWQLSTKDGLIYIDIKTNMPDARLEREHAIDLARHYAGDIESDVYSIHRITEFSDDYPAINRYLPVWEVRFNRADGLRVYVDTMTDRLGAVTNNNRLTVTAAFSYIHRLSFLDFSHTLRLAVLGVLAFAVFLSGVYGAILMLRVPKRWTLRTLSGVHRVVGAIVLVPVFMFSCSALFHLSVQFNPATAVKPVLEYHALSSIKLPYFIGDFQQVKLMHLPDGNAYWRMVLDKDVIIFDASRGVKLSMSDAEFARLYLSGNSVPDGIPEKIEKFNNQYGFAYKRLPVWRFVLGDGQHVFIDTLDGSSLLVAPYKFYETWSFTKLHKWQFLDPYTGKTGRDIVIVIFALLIVAVAVIGLIMKARSSRR